MEALMPHWRMVLGVVKDNIGFFHLITQQIISWQFSKQLEPEVIIYWSHYMAGDVVKHQQHLSSKLIPNIPHSE